MNDEARMVKVLEDRIREKVREIAAKMRHYADEMERAAESSDITDVPASATQVFVNSTLNLRLDLPAVWLGELVKLERAERERSDVRP